MASTIRTLRKSIRNDHRGSVGATKRTGRRPADTDTAVSVPRRQKPVAGVNRVEERLELLGRVGCGGYVFNGSCTPKNFVRAMPSRLLSEEVGRARGDMGHGTCRLTSPFAPNGEAERCVGGREQILSRKRFKGNRERLGLSRNAARQRRSQRAFFKSGFSDRRLDSACRLTEPCLAKDMRLGWSAAHQETSRTDCRGCILFQLRRGGVG